MLTVRAHKIVNKLLMAKRPLRIKDLSASFDVTTRTIKYDLETVRDWFSQFGVDCHSQPNKGIWNQQAESIQPMFTK